jgi:uncharacterized protein YlxW (UPF0749 family)
MVLLAFLVGLLAVLAAIVFCVVRGFSLWRQAKSTGAMFTAEMAVFEERSALTERLLQEADRSNQDLQAAVARLKVSRARLQVQLDSLDRARRSVRWLTAFLPAR